MLWHWKNTPKCLTDKWGIFQNHIFLQKKWGISCSTQEVFCYLVVFATCLDVNTSLCETLTPFSLNARTLCPYCHVMFQELGYAAEACSVRAEFYTNTFERFLLYCCTTAQLHLMVWHYDIVGNSCCYSVQIDLRSFNINRQCGAPEYVIKGRGTYSKMHPRTE